MPLNSFAVSNFPVITGGRVAVGSGVGVPDISSGREALQSLKRDPAINNRGENRGE